MAATAGARRSGAAHRGPGLARGLARRRALVPALGVAALAALLGGCGQDAAFVPTAPPTTAGATRSLEPADADAPVLRVADVGGLAAAGAALARVPAVSVYADGRVITPDGSGAVAGSSTAALPSLVQHDVGAAGAARLVRLAREAGVGTDALLGDPGVADATTTRFTVLIDGAEVSTDAYALQEAAGSAPLQPEGTGPGDGATTTLTDAQRAERASLLQLRAALTDVEATLGQQVAGPALPYRPSALAVLAEPAGTDGAGDPGGAGALGGAVAPAPWPGPALPGAPVGATRTTCVVAQGARLGPALDAAAAAGGAARVWSWGGSAWSLAFHPLLPDERGCADAVGPGAA